MARGPGDTIRPRNAHLRRLLLASYVFTPLVAALNAQALFLHWPPGHSPEALVAMGLAATLLLTSEGNNHLIAERHNLGDAESQLIDMPQPARQPVPTPVVLGHHILS